MACDLCPPRWRPQGCGRLRHRLDSHDTHEIFPNPVSSYDAGAGGDGDGDAGDAATAAAVTECQTGVDAAIAEKDAKNPKKDKRKVFKDG